MGRHLLSIFLFFTLQADLIAQIPPTCYDGVQNGYEVDIDCGGECLPCADGLTSGVFDRDSLNYQYPFAIWLPPGYDIDNPYRRFPLIIFLHGNGEKRGTNPLNPRTTTYDIQNHGPMKQVRKSWWQYPFIIVNPIRSGDFEASELEIFKNEILDHYLVDTTKVYLTGLSGGSFAIADYVIDYPEEMASVVSISGYFPYLNFTNCYDIKGLPIWYFHNRYDGTVKFKHGTIYEVSILDLNCGSPSPDPYTFVSIFSNGGHNSWSKIYDPYLNVSNPSAYSSQYDLADLTYLTMDINWDNVDYDIYQKTFGIPNGVENIYDWFLTYENVPNRCRNLIQDGDETGIDCGGSCKSCNDNYECNNGILDVGEQSIDCGGTCPACERTVVWSNGSWNAANGPQARDQTIIREDYNGGFSAKSLYIEDGASFTVTGTLEVIEELQIDGALIVPSGSSLITYEETDVSSNITFQKTTRFADGRYSFVGSPVKQSNANTTADLGPLVYTYDESLTANTNDLGRWILANGSEDLLPGKGYAQASQSMIEVTGVPNTGSMVISGSHVHDGWNLVSNPYPAAIDIEKFIDNNPNITGSIYIWDDNGSNNTRGISNDYIIANRIGAIDLHGVDNASRWNDHIGSFQGFFVQLNGSSGDIYFNEEMRVSGKNSEDNFFRRSDIPLIRIELRQGELVSRSVLGNVGYIEGNELVPGYDAELFESNFKHGIYTLKNGKLLAIQAISENTKEVPIGYRVPENSIAEINVESSNIADDLYLLDKKSGSMIQVAGNMSYNFLPESDTEDDRFSIVKIPTVSDQEENISGFYAYRKTLYYHANNSVSQIKLFDINGKLQANLKASNSSKFDLKHLPNGLYILYDGHNRKKILLQD